MASINYKGRTIKVTPEFRESIRKAYDTGLERASSEGKIVNRRNVGKYAEAYTDLLSKIEKGDIQFDEVGTGFTSKSEIGREKAGRRGLDKVFGVGQRGVESYALGLLGDALGKYKEKEPEAEEVAPAYAREGFSDWMIRRQYGGDAKAYDTGIAAIDSDKKNELMKSYLKNILGKEKGLTEEATSYDEAYLNEKYKTEGSGYSDNILARLNSDDISNDELKEIAGNLGAGSMYSSIMTPAVKTAPEGGTGTDGTAGTPELAELTSQEHADILQTLNTQVQRDAPVWRVNEERTKYYRDLGDRRLEMPVGLKPGVDPIVSIFDVDTEGNLSNEQKSKYRSTKSKKTGDFVGYNILRDGSNYLLRPDQEYLKYISAKEKANQVEVKTSPKGDARTGAVTETYKIPELDKATFDKLVGEEQAKTKRVNPFSDESLESVASFESLAPEKQTTTKDVIQTRKEGGVIKFQEGGTFSWDKGAFEVYEAEKSKDSTEEKDDPAKEPAIGTDRTAADVKVSDVFLGQGEELDAADWADVTALGLDLSGLIAGFTGVGSIGSAALGATATTASLSADYMRANEDDDITFAEGTAMAKNALLGYGMDAIAAIPGIGIGADIVKTTSRLRRMAKPLGKLAALGLKSAGVAGAATGAGTLYKFTSGEKDWGDASIEDLRDIMNLVSGAKQLSRAAANRARYEKVENPSKVGVSITDQKATGVINRMRGKKATWDKDQRKKAIDDAFADAEAKGFKGSKADFAIMLKKEGFNRNTPSNIKVTEESTGFVLKERPFMKDTGKYSIADIATGKGLRRGLTKAFSSPVSPIKGSKDEFKLNEGKIPDTGIKKALTKKRFSPKGYKGRKEAVAEARAKHKEELDLKAKKEELAYDTKEVRPMTKEQLLSSPDGSTYKGAKGSFTKKDGKWISDKTGKVIPNSAIDNNFLKQTRGLSQDEINALRKPKTERKPVEKKKAEVKTEKPTASYVKEAEAMKPTKGRGAAVRRARISAQRQRISDTKEAKRIADVTDTRMKKAVEEGPVREKRLRAAKRGRIDSMPKSKIVTNTPKSFAKSKEAAIAKNKEAVDKTFSKVTVPKNTQLKYGDEVYTRKGNSWIDSKGNKVVDSDEVTILNQQQLKNMGISEKDIVKTRIKVKDKKKVGKKADGGVIKYLDGGGVFNPRTGQFEEDLFPDDTRQLVDPIEIKGGFDKSYSDMPQDLVKMDPNRIDVLKRRSGVTLNPFGKDVKEDPYRKLAKKVSRKENLLGASELGRVISTSALNKRFDTTHNVPLRQTINLPKTRVVSDLAGEFASNKRMANIINQAKRSAGTDQQTNQAMMNQAAVNAATVGAQESARRSAAIQQARSRLLGEEQAQMQYNTQVADANAAALAEKANRERAAENAKRVAVAQPYLTQLKDTNQRTKDQLDQIRGIRQGIAGRVNAADAFKHDSTNRAAIDKLQMESDTLGSKLTGVASTDAVIRKQIAAKEREIKDRMAYNTGVRTDLEIGKIYAQLYPNRTNIIKTKGFNE